MKKISLLIVAFMLAIVFVAKPTYAAYDESNVAFLGDSITYGLGTTAAENIYSALVGEALEFDNVYNYGVSGSRIAKEADRTDSFYERYTLMEADLDVIFVFGGVNDFQTGELPLGTNTDAVDTTLYGNINLLMDGLQTTYPDAEIIFLTAYNYDNGSFDSKIANATTGLTLDEINEAVRSRAIVHKINVIELDKFFGADLYADDDAIDRYTSDGLHLNDEGHDHLSNLLISYIQRTEADYFGENLFNEDTIVEGYRIQNDNEIYHDEHTSTLFYSDYIEVKPGYSYVGYAQVNSSKAVYSSYVYFYDANKNYVSHPTNDLLNPIFTIPDGVKYIRINGSTIDERITDTYVRELINYPIYKVDFVTGLYSEYESQWIEEGSLIDVNQPTSAYNTFAGWYTDAAYDTLFDIDSDEVMTDLVLYAKWSDGSGDAGSGGNITPSPEAETFELFGIAWYWYLGAAAVVYFGFTKKGRKVIGLK